MPRIKVMAFVAAIALAVWVGGQIGYCEWANVQLQEDLHDIASQAGTRIGYLAPRSDDDFRDAVVRKAKEHDIHLEPSQVSVQRTETGTTSTVSLAADYRSPVKLPGFSFALHFTPSSAK